MNLKTTIAIFTALMLFSCSESDEPIVPSEKTDEQISETQFLTEQQAADIATNALRLFLNPGTSSRSERSFSATISHYPSFSRSSEVKAYIINFDEGGYAVVSANPDDPEILAINGEGTFEPVNQPCNAYFMTLADEYLANKADIDTTYIKPILPGERPVDPDPGLAYIMHGGHRCGHEIKTIVTIEKFNLINTSWHQEMPYNKYCLLTDPYSGYEYHAVAGCVPVALAQIMAFHRKPAEFEDHIFNWEEITSTSGLAYGSKNADDVAYLIYRIGKTANITLGIIASAVSRPNIIPTLNKFGYTNIKETEYSENTILAEVLEGRPVAISGGSTNPYNQNETDYHRWIIDGAYKTATRQVNINLDTNNICYTVDKAQAIYFHCNWGWKAINSEETSNGFYLSRVFNPRTYNFNQDFHIIYNIH